jgi:hypothetical protein
VLRGENASIFIAEGDRWQFSGGFEGNFNGMTD